MYDTKDIAIKTGVSRQTLHSWIKESKITKPQKQTNGRLIWTDNHIKEIEQNIKELNIKGDDSNGDLKTLNIGNRRYLGSKQKALDFIWETVSKQTNGVNTIADIFSGTGVVADFFMRKGYKVIVNDILYSNYVSYKTWFDSEKINKNKIKEILMYLNNLEGEHGYVTQNFGNKYFTLENSMKIDSIREEIEKLKFKINDREYAILLTSLLYAIDKVANTVGHFDAYRLTMDSTNKLELRMPNIFISEKENRIFNEDANLLIKNLKADLVYIDTPYNSRGYENMYHVLENIIEWKKPEVEGVAMKAVNRSEKGSDYTKSNAPIALDNLISNIDSKYILISYNNTGKKGNSRSNAKISHHEIISTLLKRGHVQVYETDFAPFTTGKTNIEEHKEILYLCEVNNKINYINTPLNYAGSKYRLIPQIFPLLPDDIKRFIEPFSGGAVISVNHALYNKDKNIEYYINDIEKNIIELYSLLRRMDHEKLLSKIERLISHYGFTNTYINGYDFYNCNSQQGLGECNKESFNILKNDFNNSKGRKTIKRTLQFYLLIIFGFNNQIRFNNEGNFNLPVGKRDFNANMRRKFFEFHSAINSTDFNFSSKSYDKFTDIKPGDFIYVDPPYSLGTASYNENGKWTSTDDNDLFKYLDRVDAHGGKFAMSNVVLHKNRENHKLMEWASRYNLHVLDYNYNNSNYQSTANKSSTVEVLITNY